MRSEYVTMTPPPSDVVEEEREVRPPPERGAPRLPCTGSASAYPMRQEYYSILCRNWQDVRKAFPWGKAKRKSPMWGIDKRWKAGIMKIGGSPCLLTEVIVSWGTMGGYFFSIWIYLENQRNDADDQDADLNEIRIRDHLHHPLM